MNDFAAQFLLFEHDFPQIALLVACGLKSTAIVFLALAIAALLRNRSASARCWIWRLTFLGAAAVLVFDFMPRTFGAVRPRVAISITNETASAFQNEARKIGLMRSTEEISRIFKARSEERASVPGGGPPWQHGKPPQIRSSEMLSETWLRIDSFILEAWGIGAALFLLVLGVRTAIGFVWLRRRSGDADQRVLETAAGVSAEMGIRNRMEVRMSAAIASPVMFGVFRPLIFLPDDALDWSSGKLSSVFLHELAHGKRGDFPWLQFGRVMLTLFWWNPLMQVALRRMSAAAEEAADDFVILRKPAQDYAQVLIEVAAADPFSGRQPGLSMLGCHSLENRIRCLMRENPWRGKYGKYAAGAILSAAAAIALMSTLSVVQAYPALSKPLPLEAEQKSLIERIIKNTEKRLTDFRFTHVKLEMTETETVNGSPLKYPSPSKLEAWNDSWTHIYRAQFRPQVSRWENGTKPFITENKNYIGNGKSNLFYSVDFLATDNESRPQPPEAMNPDYLGIREAGDLLDILRSMLLMSMFSHVSSVIRGNMPEPTIAEIEWQGKPAVQIQEILSADGKAEQKRTFVVVPEENDMLRFSETALHSDRTNSISQWVVNKVERASTGQYYPAIFTASFSGNIIESKTDFTVSSFEVLSGIPEGITGNPRADFKGTK